MTSRNAPFRGPARLACAAVLLAVAFPASAPASAQASLQVLHSVELPAEGADGRRILELSGLAWDADEQLLYAVSDGGDLHHFRLRIENERIAAVEPVFSVPIAAAGGSGSGKPVDNAEGLASIGSDNGQRSDTELLIAFEDGPTISRFSPRGEWIADIALPDMLADPERYSGKNSGIEAVAAHPRHGVLTAPERPLKGQGEDRHTIYAADGPTWSFTASHADGRLKALEGLPDGNLLVLERTREEKGGPVAARLGYLDLATCAAGGDCGLARLAPGEDAGLADNFEGLARLSDELFLIVTDRTKKEGPTKLVLLKVSRAP